MVTRDARYAILTNGIIYQFFTELDEKNRMDITPFLTIDMDNLDERLVRELERFTKDPSTPTRFFHPQESSVSCGKSGVKSPRNFASLPENSSCTSQNRCIPDE